MMMTANRDERSFQAGVGDPAEMLRSAFYDLVDLGLEALVAWLQRPRAAPSLNVVEEHDRLGDAATLLAVERLAGEHEIRAAFRARVKEAMTEGTFHDQKGGGTDARAQQLIEAKNLLLENLRRSAVSHD
jgi:lysozyme family protein